LIKLLLRAPLVLPMTADNAVIENGGVLVDQESGKILAVGEGEALAGAHPDATLRVLEHRLLMPGLVNAHCHSGMLRGTAEGLPVWDWLQQYIDPMHRVLNEREAEASSWLCYAESLLCGTTTVVDMWRYMHGSARAAAQLGIRAVLVPYVAEHPEHDYFETLRGNEALIKASGAKVE